MAVDPVAARYGQAIFEVAKQESRVDEVREELRAVGGLMTRHPELRALLLNPDVDPPDKVGIIERLLGGAWSALVRSFVTMVIQLDRVEAVPGIVEAFDALVDADRGQLRVVVRSAHPVPQPLLDRLRQGLERIESKQIDVATEIVPALLGGLQIVLGHRVIDSSVQRQLADLRQQLKSIRVH